MQQFWSFYSRGCGGRGECNSLGLSNIIPLGAVAVVSATNQDFIISFFITDDEVVVVSVTFLVVILLF